MAHPPLDPVSIGIAAATLVVGAGAAQYVGPYSVIALGAFLGALIALRRRERDSRMHALLYVMALFCWSVALTVPVAEWTAGVIGRDWKWLVFPVATGLAALGDGWAGVAAKVKGLYLRALDSLRAS